MELHHLDGLGRCGTTNLRSQWGSRLGELPRTQRLDGSARQTRILKNDRQFVVDARLGMPSSCMTACTRSPRSSRIGRTSATGSPAGSPTSQSK